MISLSDKYVIYDKIIIFGNEYNLSFEEIIDTIEEHKINKLLFIDSFDSTNIVDCWNEYLTKPAGYCYWFDKPLTKLPDRITHLIFSYNSNFNHSIDSEIVSGLKYLIFGDFFNKQVDNLPSNLIMLIFGCGFNYSIDNLPIKLKLLCLGNEFNQPINNLPNSITYLIFGYNFNNSINNLPNSIINVQFCSEGIFDHNLDNLPESLEYLVLPIKYTKSIQNIPQYLQTIISGPKRLEHIRDVHF